MVKRMLNQELVRSWNSWAQMAYFEASTFELMQRVARVFLHRQLARGLRGWHQAFLDDNRRSEATLEAMRACVARMVRRGLSRCWESWKVAASSAAHAYEVDDAMRRVIRALINRSLRRGWLG